MKRRITRIAAALCALASLLAVVSCTNQLSSPQVDNAVPAPVFSLDAGVYEEEVEVALSSPLAGAKIYYADASVPGASPEEYTGPILVQADEQLVTIRAYALAVDGKSSESVEKSYTVKPKDKVATPRTNYPRGTYEEPIDVVLSCATPGAAIRYTLDGSAPGKTSAVYAAPIRIPAGSDLILKAVACKDGLKGSSFAIRHYAVKAAPVPDRNILVISEQYFSRYHWKYGSQDSGVVEGYFPEIGSVSPSGGGIVRLTDGNLEDHATHTDPYFSSAADFAGYAANAKIVYKYFLGVSYPPFSQTDFSMYEMNVDGTGKRELAGLSFDHLYPDIRISPDGTKIAFGFRQNWDNGDTGIFVADADGTNLRFLASSGETTDLYELIAWAADSERIIYAKNDELFIMKWDWSDTPAPYIPFLDSNQEVSTMGWNRTGTKVAFVREENGAGEIFVAKADGSGQTNLTNNDAMDADPRWSPDGTRIAFTTDRDGNREVYVMNADGTNAVNVTNDPHDDICADW